MEEEKKVSKFSSGLNILMRVDSLWKNCHSLKRGGLYYKWNEELDSVWLELARDLSPENYGDTDENGKVTANSDKVEKKGYKTQFDSFDGEIKKLLPFVDNGGSGFSNPSDESVKKRDEQYKILMEKQLFLARLENELGKGTSWDEEDEDF